MTNRKIPYAANMVKVCWFTTLRDLGYRTSVAVQNPINPPTPRFGPLDLSLDLFDTDALPVVVGLDLGELISGGRRVVGFDDLIVETGLTTDVVGILHMTPRHLAGSETCTVDTDEIAAWTAACDEFVGYTHVASGLVSGVHYQSPPMNEDRIRSSKSMIVQSPKVVVGDCLDSHFLVFSPSSDPAFDSTVRLDLAVLATNGRVVARDIVEVPARGRRRVSVTDILSRAGAIDDFLDAGGLGMLIALTSGGVVTPLSLVHDPRGGLAVDHTLPPPYYVPWWGGEARREAVTELVSNLFPGELR